MSEFGFAGGKGSDKERTGELGTRREIPPLGRRACRKGRGTKCKDARLLRSE